MSEKKMPQKKQCKNNKCKIKCKTCQFYIADEDYCTERDIEYCTRNKNVNFSQCSDYLTKEKLLYF